ncbi:MAG: hypothetical protein JWP97_4681 [Labilithrix sp.]|nr:hypothetical protein [Labilithrix sp.]
MSFSMSPRLRRGIALCSVVLATGGLVLHRTTASAHPGETTARPAPLAPGKMSAAFAGPGAHGMVSLSHARLLPSSTTSLFAEVRVIADEPNGEQQARAPLSIAVVLDTSGSMSGEKIEEARRSVTRLVSDMRDDDEITVVRYSDSAEVIQPLARVGTVREALSARIRQLDAGGGTNIPSGMSAGIHALDEAARGRVRRLVVVSDGLDTTRQEAERLARTSFSSGITVSSLGIGIDFDERYMGSLAQNGHGNFAFVKDGASLAQFLHRELEETAKTTVENARVRLQLPTGIRFVSASGADAVVRGNDVELALGSLFAGDERRVIVELSATSQGEALDVGATATWSSVGGVTATARAPSLVLGVASSRDDMEAGRDGAVLASATSVVTSRRQLEATDAYAAGNVALATSLTDENEKALAEVRAIAPPAATTALDSQLAAYGSLKRGYATVSPRSADGKAAAKTAAAKDIGNFARKGF